MRRLARRRDGFPAAESCPLAGRAAPIALGSAAAVLLATALVLVEHVQTDPLQVGAVQVARLTVDQGYALPPFFGGYEGDGGLRAVTYALIFSPAAANGSTCLTATRSPMSRPVWTRSRARCSHDEVVVFADRT